MIRFENECIGCPSNMGCIGDACMYRYSPVYICDKCGDEVDELYEYFGEEYCEECLRSLGIDIEDARRIG